MPWPTNSRICAANVCAWSQPTSEQPRPKKQAEWDLEGRPADSTDRDRRTLCPMRRTRLWPPPRFETTVVPACRFSRLSTLGGKWNEGPHGNFPVESLLLFFPSRERHRTIRCAIVKEPPDLFRIAFGGRGQRKPDSVNTLADIRTNPTRIGGHDGQTESGGFAEDDTRAFGAGWENQEMRCSQELGKFALTLR